jgi:hypothetical protein
MRYLKEIISAVFDGCNVAVGNLLVEQAEITCTKSKATATFSNLLNFLSMVHTLNIKIIFNSTVDCMVFFYEMHPL